MVGEFSKDGRREEMEKILHLEQIILLLKDKRGFVACKEAPREEEQVRGTLNYGRDMRVPPLYVCMYVSSV